MLHEQNAVMGRANRFLAAARLAHRDRLSRSEGRRRRCARKTRYTGNPVRPAVLAAAATPYPDFADGRLSLLVTGGSQGARVMSDVVPAALALLAPEERARIRLTMQARGEDKSRVAGACARMGFPVEIAEFFPDLPARIAAAHLVVGRAGASTVSELAVIGRPSILVPFPHALDQDQAANAAMLAAAGAATVVPQSEFTPERLAGLLRGALADPQARLTRRRSRQSGRRRRRGRAAGRSGAGDRAAGAMNCAAGGRRALWLCRRRQLSPRPPVGGRSRAQLSGRRRLLGIGFQRSVVAQNERDHHRHRRTSGDGRKAPG